MDKNIVDFKPKTIADPGCLIALCKRYLDNIRRLGYADSTLRSYKTDLEQFVGFAASRDVTLLMHVSFNLVDSWVEALIDGLGVSRRTAARKLETLRSFIKFCHQRGIIHADPTAGLKVRFVQQKVIAPSKEQLMRVIDVIPSDTIIGKRDRAFFRLLFDSALRVGGVLSLNLYDDKDPSPCCVEPSGVVHYQAKGGKHKATVVDDETLKILNEWLSVRFYYDNKFVDALFISRQGRRMCRGTVWNRLKKYGKKAGLPHVYCHLFRHRRLGEIYEKTGDLRIAADIGGHENMNTFAEIYGLRSAEHVRHQIRTLAPLDDMGGAA